MAAFELDEVRRLVGAYPPEPSDHWPNLNVESMGLYTKNGKPLRVSGDDIFDASGRHVGKRRGDKVYAPDGRYAGTVVGDRVVYRSTDSAIVGSAFAPRASAGTAEANRTGSAVWGEEPFE
jgi:hypothetical protein